MKKFNIGDMVLIKEVQKAGHVLDFNTVGTIEKIAQGEDHLFYCVLGFCSKENIFKVQLLEESEIQEI
jgi:hypothetical protein